MQNKYPGKCYCGKWVEAGEGETFRDKTTERWVVRCPEHAEIQYEIPAYAAEDIRKEANTAGTYASNPSRSYTPPAHQQSLPLTAAALYRTAMAPRTKGEYVLLSGHKASDAQAAVFEHFEFGHGSRIIEAVAGSGKTTTMKNALRYADARLFIQMFAFNRSAANQLKDAIEELKTFGERDYSRVRAGTFHSVGLGAVRKYLNLPEAQFIVEQGNNAKIQKLFKEFLNYDKSEEGTKLYKLYTSFVCALVGFAKGEGVGCLVQDTPDIWWKLIGTYAVSLDSDEADMNTGIEYARQMLAKSNEAAKTGWCDYNDMLYLPVLWKLKLWQNDIVICDEAQDTSPIRLAILHMSLRSGGRLYAVGDRFQSIYQFAGASSDAMDQIQQRFNCATLPLSVSYRCARRIVERAQTWVPHIMASDFAEEGLVEDDVPLVDALKVLTDEDAILCRQTAPLVELAYKLISAGRACRILGREIGDGLVNLIEQQKAKGIDRLVDKLGNWRNREMAKFIAKGEETKAEAVADRVECITVLIGSLPETERTIPALIAKIDGMFSDEGDKRKLLTLSSQHRSKGQEYPRVAILQPNLNPSKAARTQEAVDQEYHLMYVACTRAKQHLIYCRYNDMDIEQKKAA